MLHKYILIALISSAVFLLTSGPSFSAEKPANNLAPGQDAGYAKVSGKAHLDEPAQAMPFTDGPDGRLKPDTGDADKNSDSMISSEMLKALDTTQSGPSAFGPADGDSGLRGINSLENDILDPLLLVKDEHRGHVDRNVSMFSKTLKDRFKVWLARSGKYIDMMKSVFREKNLPEDLVYLALIESGFNPKAYSWASASGPWQFISGTGKKYGLKINSWVDERRDPEKSTRAAAAYLQDLYNMFGSWSLAMAAYNSGEGNVSRAVQRNGTLDFWELRKTRSLAAETKEYVPKYLAARAIALSPQSYGLDGIEYEDPLSYDVVKLDKSIDLAVAARLCGTSVEAMKELNPELKRGCTPPNTPGYRLKVPKGMAEMFASNRDSLPASETAGWREYVARRGDTLSKVAARFDVPVSRLADVNSMKRSSRLRSGQRILIPSSEVATAAYTVPDTAEVSTVEPEEKPVERTRTHKVRRGDTLSKVARRYGMSISKLARLNGLRTRSKLRTGQRLKLSAPARTHTNPDAASQTDASSGTTTTTTYRVRKGDTLSKIASRHGVSSKALADMNGISRRSVLKVGQRIKIGGGTVAVAQAETVSSGTYKVRRGDTLWSIARKLGVSVDDLKSANSLGSRSVIKSGMKLNVPGKGGMET